MSFITVLTATNLIRGGGSNLRKELGFGPNDKVIVFIGEITPEKGVEDFIDSAQHVHSKLNNCWFLIAGTGDDYFVDRIKNKIISSGSRNHLRLLGFRKDIINILNGIDLLVLPSRHLGEGLPRVVIEAMSCEKPVVGTNVKGINEVVDDGLTGLLVPPKDPEKLANAILTILEDNEKAQAMGIKGRKRIKSLFTIDKNVYKIQEIYRQVPNT